MGATAVTRAAHAVKAEPPPSDTIDPADSVDLVPHLSEHRYQRILPISCVVWACLWSHRVFVFLI